MEFGLAKTNPKAANFDGSTVAKMHSQMRKSYSRLQREKRRGLSCVFGNVPE
jgi:hypothetical protein